MTTKAALRARFQAWRATLADDVRRVAAERIAKTVLDFEPFAGARTVALFASFRDELPTDSLVTALRRTGMRVLLPRVEDVGVGMSLCDFSTLDALGRDRLGIRTPDGPVFSGTVDLVFVPGLAFSLDGGRLGYGGGFYDRLLARAQHALAVRCGLGFAEQVVEQLPSEAHDLRLTYIATPERVLVCSG